MPVPLCPPQIPHGLTLARTRASAVRGRRLTTFGTAKNVELLTVKADGTYSYRSALKG
jgi:hypothetical protein